MNSNFIFIHIPKNAGQSVKKALNLHHRCTMPASEHISNIGLNKFNEKFSFAFTRNPWDRQISFYKFICNTKTHHLHSKVKPISFEGYIKDVLPNWGMVNFSQRSYVYSPSGVLLVKFLGRFENLENDFEIVCNKIGVNVSLPKINSTAHKHYSEYYNEETKRIVGEIFEKDIKILGYKYAN